MPKVRNKKLNIIPLQKLSEDEQIKILEPLLKANAEQFSKIANTVSESSRFAQSIQNLSATLRLQTTDILERLKLPEIVLPQIPDMFSPMDLNVASLDRYDPPVTIRKSKRELEKEAREAYMTELQIQVLEQQLNLYKGMLAPQYDINTGIITFMGKNIEIPLNTNMEMVCRVVLKNMANMQRKWSWDEIVEENRELLTMSMTDFIRSFVIR